MIWYLLIFGFGYHTSTKVPEPSRAICIQQANAFDAWLQSAYGARGTIANAFCIQGLKEGSSGVNG